MAEQKTNMTDEQLAQGLRKSKGGKLGADVLEFFGRRGVEISVGAAFDFLEIRRRLGRRESRYLRRNSLCGGNPFFPRGAVVGKEFFRLCGKRGVLGARRAEVGRTEIEVRARGGGDKKNCKIFHDI